jgi:hypothetical protein
MTWLLSFAIVVAATYGLWLYARWVDDVRFDKWFGPRGTTLSWHDEDPAIETVTVELTADAGPFLAALRDAERALVDRADREGRP